MARDEGWNSWASVLTESALSFFLSVTFLIANVISCRSLIVESWRAKTCSWWGSNPHLSRCSNYAHHRAINLPVCRRQCPAYTTTARQIFDFLGGVLEDDRGQDETRYVHVETEKPEGAHNMWVFNKGMAGICFPEGIDTHRQLMLRCACVRLSLMLMFVLQAILWRLWPRIWWIWGRVWIRIPSLLPPILRLWLGKVIALSGSGAPSSKPTNHF